MMKQFDKILQENLVSNNNLSDEEIKDYSRIAKDAGMSLKEYLLSNHIVTERQILVSLSKGLNLESVELTKIHVEQGVIDKVPVKFAWYYKIMPVKYEDNTITVASAKPIDVILNDEIRMNLGVNVNFCLALESEINDALKKYYGFTSDTIDKIISKDPVRKASVSATDVQWIEDIERETQDPTVSNLVNQIILEAFKKRATDIHIEPYRDKVRFRYRIDGVLVDANVSDKLKHFLAQILSRIKILANLSITERRLPQDGSTVVKTREQNLDLRISTMPTPMGESMVIRILPTKIMLFSLEKLGFNQDTVEKFRDLIKNPYGIVFLTGPTGSGKTTTLYACLNEINSPERKIITIEDPVEYEMEGITQVQVNSKVDFNFSNGLRSILRHDPDIIMVGEVRDVETAEIAIRTALTGHMVFSTLHTNDSASGITRLIDMGIEPYLVSSSVEAFVAQRLVRVNCPKCKKEVVDVPAGIKKEIERSLFLTEDQAEDIKIFKGEGCDYCNHTGYFGRMAIYEILRVNDAIRTAVLEYPRADYIKRIAMQEGMVSLRQNGWKAVLEGQTTPSEIMNVTIKDEEKDLIAVRKKRDRKHLGDRAFESEQMSYAKTEGLGAIKRVTRGDKIKRQSTWEVKNLYDARIFPRVFEHVEIRYCPLKIDATDPNFLVPSGVEYTTVTEDISAGGLRFISKERIQIGSIIELKIYIDHSQKAIECLAKVCRVEEDSMENIYTMVNYYLDLSSADRSSIRKFIENTTVE
ncbi:MAG: Flp pilus assembly complex ATPase component TadA [Candidatus Omnitrophica bacterium]|nr:Flp pilus assembly complex ATPase component TadA [Candidatus Omnitrophota bacterium]MBU1996437.1 Flp pilus assembly complex ATPase component TadA [Candidatus Omnitrophota bacterium]